MRHFVSGCCAASVLLVLAAVPLAAQQQDPKAILRAADALVGASKVNSIQYNATGRWSFIGQNFTVNDDWPRVDVKSYAMTIDYPSKSERLDFTRVQGNNPGRGGGAGFPIVGEQRAQEFVNGDTAWNMNAQGQPQRVVGDDAEARQWLMWVSPHGFIKAALASPNVTESERHFVDSKRTLHVVGFTMGKYRATGEFNDQNMLERVVTWIPSPMMGDMQVEIRYSDYRDIGNGIKMPFHIHEHQGDHPLVRGMNWMDIQLSDAKANVANAATAVPATLATPQSQAVASRQLAPGVWYIGGGSHNSVAVEMTDYITLIEAPLDDARTMAVIAEAKRLIPGKPIRYVVNTHHHWDHSGGLRAAYAEGATIVTNEQNRNFFERVILAPQPRSLHPDRLSLFPFATTGPGPGKLETYRDQYTITDGKQSVISYHLTNFNHAQDMAVVYLLPSKILINADMYSPPAAGGNLPAVNANAVSLFNNIKRLNLDVSMHVPIHGNPGGNADFVRIVGPVAARARPAGAQEGG